MGGHGLVKAEQLCRAALALALADPAARGGYEDFALQHLGKGRLEEGDAAEAITCVERALTLRQAKGDPALIASTEAVLRLAKELATQLMGNGRGTDSGSG